ncbi:uncharacterized protein [Macrobrachium rosenbergii]|uniref:uncharacterized protein n=1 Tax=Macrobrachium rosenbergii TaxID=79674 RepID=UPI0034D6A840
MEEYFIRTVSLTEASPNYDRNGGWQAGVEAWNCDRATCPSLKRGSVRLAIPGPLFEDNDPASRMENPQRHLPGDEVKKQVSVLLKQGAIQPVFQPIRTAAPSGTPHNSASAHKDHRAFRSTPFTSVSAHKDSDFLQERFSSSVTLARHTLPQCHLIQRNIGKEDGLSCQALQKFVKEQIAEKRKYEEEQRQQEAKQQREEEEREEAETRAKKKKEKKPSSWREEDEREERQKTA